MHDEAGRWYLTRVLPYRSTEDRIEGVVITFVDITRRKQAERDLRESEERYHTLVNNATEYAIFIVDLEGRIASWNEGAQRIFGYAKKEIVGRPFSDLFGEEERSAGIPLEEVKTAKRTGIAKNDGWRIRKDGSRFWASGTMEALLTSPNGQFRGFAKVLRDNTERKQADEALRRLNETLEERVEERTREVRELASHLTMAEHRERDRIAGILHDDLQQLLYSIQLKLAFMRENVETGDRTDLTDRIAKAEQALGEAGQIVQRLSVDLSPQVLEKDGLREAVRWLAEQMREQYGLEATVESKHSFPVPKSWRVLLFQAVRELLFNVVKHAGVKQAKVELRREGDELLIRISDRGEGFEASALDEHVGFGISNVGRRLSLEGGRMDIDSRPGKGTIVTICVPLALLNERAS